MYGWLMYPLSADMGSVFRCCGAIGYWCWLSGGGYVRLGDGCIPISVVCR